MSRNIFCYSLPSSLAVFRQMASGLATEHKNTQPRKAAKFENKLRKFLSDFPKKIHTNGICVVTAFQWYTFYAKKLSIICVF